ncbi:MFS transporter [Sporomusa aerivorans]|uniref:MFS transporter n=1 Tax=Sporomusa aerivorans TaxID=204936 RepID=UPI00352A2DC5
MSNMTETSHTPIPKPNGNLRWKMSFLLLLGGIINYFDRANIAVAAPEMMKELHFTNTDIGLIGAVFSWAYALGQLPSGWLVDRLGAKKIYTQAVIWWSAATAATGLCNTLPSFLAVRVWLGIAEAPCMPTSAKITSYWFPQKERGLASGIWDASSKVGPALAVPVLVALMIEFGWRALFYITGAAGIIYVVLFALYYANPDKSKSISKEELEYIKADGSGVEETTSKDTIKWGSLFTYRSMWGMMLGYFCVVWLSNIFQNFVPLYLVKSYNVSLKDLGVYATLPWVGGIFGDLVGGYMTKLLVEKKSMEPMKAKRAVISVSALVAAVMAVAISYSPSISVSVALMAVSIGSIAAISANTWALASDVAPRALVASVGSIQNFGGFFGGAFSPIVVGMIADKTGSFALAFISGGIVAAGAALCYWFIVKEPIAVKSAA